MPLGYKFSWSPRGVLRAAEQGAKFRLNGKVSVQFSAPPRLLYIGMRTKTDFFDPAGLGDSRGKNIEESFPRGSDLERVEAGGSGEQG